MKLLNTIAPKWAFVFLAVVAAFAIWVVVQRGDRIACERSNEVRMEVDARTDEINSIRNAVGVHLLSRLAGDQELIAEGVEETRRALDELDGVEADPVPPVDCPSWP